MKHHVKAFLALVLAVCLLALPATGLAAGEEATGIESLEQLGQITASGSYRLDADITVPDGVMLTVPDELNITLDLNGHKVEKPQGNGRILDNYGTMVINDSKGTGVVDAYRNAVGNFGHMTINGGTFITHSTEGGTTILNEAGGTMVFNSVVINASNFAHVNEGTCTINGGEFHSTSSNRNGNWAYCVRNSNIMTVNHATITGIQGALASNAGTLTVKGDNFSTDWDDSASFYALYIAGEADVVQGFVYGGNFSSPKHAIHIGNDNTNGDGGINADATTTIYGGTFNGGISAIYGAQVTGNPYVQGGTYLKNGAPDPVVKSYLANGFIFEESTGKVKDARVSAVTLDRSTAILNPEDTLLLNATVTAGEAADKTVTFASSDASVATVDAQGNVTAQAAGTAQITATAGDKSASCTVVVVEKAQPPQVDPDEPVDTVTPGLPQQAADAVNDQLKDVVDQIVTGGTPDAVSPQTQAAIAQAAQQGSAIALQIQAQPVDPQAVGTDAEKALALVGENGQIAQYLDIRLVITADGQPIGTLDQLDAPVKVQVLVPQALLKEGRSFYVIRVHEGVAQKLPLTLNGALGEFETDAFSTYALAYEDEQPAQGGGETVLPTPQPAAPATPTPAPTQSAGSTPDTGESGSLLPYVMLALLAFAAIICTLGYKLRAHRAK